MITALSGRWLFTVVFVIAAAGALWPRRRRGGLAQAGARVPAVSCVAMCGSLVAMTWWSEPAGWAWAQAAVFGLAALCFGWAGLAGSAQGRLGAVLHGLMAVAMAWMLTALPVGSEMVPAERTRGSMAAGGSLAPGGSMAPRGSIEVMSGVAMSAPVLAVSVLLALCCAATAVWWLARVTGPRVRAKDSVAASHAVMSAGMAAMLFVML